MEVFPGTRVGRYMELGYLVVESWAQLCLPCLGLLPKAPCMDLRQLSPQCHGILL